MKRFIALILTLSLFIAFASSAAADTAIPPTVNDVSASLNVDSLALDLKGACLIEAESGTVLYTQDEFYSASVASVTKIMTLLLVCEALAEGRISLEDKVYVSANASSMGGSQVYLEEGEQMSVEELIKCTVIASANDAAVALSEHVSGSESQFVKKMNEKAEELGLKNTRFENATGLDDTTTEQRSCAFDVAMMSRELIKHDIILKYSSVWQDSIRDGEFTLTNTNRLVRYYQGCNGLKTGSTDKAGFCISTTAKRDGMQLIAVVIGAETKEKRNEAARTMLDFGFSGYTLKKFPSEFIENVPVNGGNDLSVPVYADGLSLVIERGSEGRIEASYNIPESINAPISESDKVGEITLILDGKEIGRRDIRAGLSVEKITLGDIFLKIIKNILLGA